jgi:hypothetical protein
MGLLIRKTLQKVFLNGGVKVDVEGLVPLGDLLDGEMGVLLRGQFGWVVMG